MSAGGLGALQLNMMQVLDVSSRRLLKAEQYFLKIYLLLTSRQTNPSRLLTMRGSHFFALCTYFVLGINATCYHPNGSAVLSADQLPCNTAIGVESMCCNTGNMTSPGRCDKDGLCISYHNDYLWRNACTDPTWRDPACLHICTLGQSKSL